ncbi:MAG TPA: N-acetylmuramoyl-L-alanine amidase [Caulobacteraceae bacterium]|nr:N-acetylmuramoyl-L-alanine amidase [Caulobacteraceae bacterium]
MRVGLGLVLAAGCAAAVMAGARQTSGPDVVNVRLGGGASETRVVVDMHAAASGSLDDADASPTELTLILKGASTANVLKGVGQGLVRGWRVENGAGGAHLVLDLAQSVAVERRFLLPPADGAANYRYVIDLAAKGPALARAPNRGAAASVAAPAADPAPAVQLAANLQAPPEHVRKVIVIDPGHGGRDSGAVGSSSYEKNVTLATALALKARLERTGRYQVVMTRDSDVYVPLEERVQIARRAGADLFLSLHADSGDASTHGASIYTLSERGEQRVGYVLGRNEWFLQEAADDQAVGQILLDLTQRTTRNRSAAFAQTLIANIGDRAPLLPRSQRDANYFVLLAPDVPAALLEMGFITNPADEARLNDPDARAALADKIAQSIDAFFNRGTRLAER